MRRLVLLLLATVLVAFSVVVVAEAATAAPAFSKPVKRGSVGKPVIDAKWILSGHNQGLRKPVIHTFRGKRTNECGKKCVRAILAARWLLGEPLKYDKSCKCRPVKRARFTRDLYLLLTTKKARPLGWIGRASTRIAAVKRQRAKNAPKCAQLVVKYARREVGVREIPCCNTGPRVRVFQATTGAYRAAWCVSFAQFVYLEAGIGIIADRTANVWYAYRWAYRRAWVRSRPAIGAWVAYLHNAGHMGIVVAINGSTVTSVEGNSGPDRVVYHVYPIGYNHAVYIVPPCPAGTR